MSLAMNAQVPSYVPTNGLVGYWPFSGNANDVSGNTNNGTNNSATLTTDRFGIANSAYTYNGTSSFINVPNSASLQFNGAITISTWFNASYIPVGATASTSYILSKGADGNTPYSWCSFLDNTNLGLSIFNNNNLNNSALIPNSKFPISLNTWYNVVYTFDGTNAKAYINGQLKTSVAATYTTFSNIYDLKFGRRHISGLPYFFNGKLDDIGVWNRALSTQEISNMYNQVTPYSDTCNAVSGSLTQGLAGYWPFCGNANDDSGKGNNGTVNGATLTTDRFGNTNSAYSFNGTSNYIEIPHSTSLNFGTKDFTISAWAKPSQYQNIDQHIITKERGLAPDNNQFRMSIQRSANVNQSDKHYYFTSATPPAPGNGLNWTSATGYVLQSNSIAPITTWSFITVVRTGINYKLYINGILNSTDNTPSGLTQDYSLNFQNLVLGAGQQATGTLKGGFFNGIIDDIGFWNRALTTNEITQLYNQNQCFTNTTVTETLVINVGQLSYTNPIAFANNITIYPNPASTQVNIAFNTITDLNGGSIKIINSLGQQVATTPIKTTGTTTTMTLSTWGGSGLYFVQIVNPQGQIVDIKKILLQ